jgi:sarcosine oxidase/L-pipecolate oxidase
LNSGVFSNEWKTEKVKSLYKGDRYDIQNYRPISVISVFAKLLERLMFNRLIPLLSENKIFTEAQNGFRKEKCIETAIQSFIEIIQESLHKELHTIGIFFDLTKAYDILNHTVLLEKLSSYAIRGTVNSWFQSYLTNQKQFIEINQSDSSNVRVYRYRSSFMEIKQGVPQGPARGPLLFLLYINDLPSNIHGPKLVMFANDINVLITDSDVGVLQSKIDRVITELESRFNRNNLVINVGKTVVMSFHNRQLKFPVKPQVTFNKMNFVYTAETKFLSIYITETSKWNSHVQSLATKLSKVSYMIKSLKEISSQYMIQNIYFKIFQSLLRFGILFWGEWGMN